MCDDHPGMHSQFKYTKGMFIFKIILSLKFD